MLWMKLGFITVWRTRSSSSSSKLPRNAVCTSDLAFASVALVYTCELNTPSLCTSCARRSETVSIANATSVILAAPRSWQVLTTSWLPHPLITNCITIYFVGLMRSDMNLMRTSQSLVHIMTPEIIPGFANTCPSLYHLLTKCWQPFKVHVANVGWCSSLQRKMSTQSTILMLPLFILVGFIACHSSLVNCTSTVCSAGALVLSQLSELKSVCSSRSHSSAGKFSSLRTADCNCSSLRHRRISHACCAVVPLMPRSARSFCSSGPRRPRRQLRLATHSLPRFAIARVDELSVWRCPG